MMSRPDKKIAIIHFQPLELYPPVMNILDQLSQNPLLELEVMSVNYNNSGSLAAYVAKSSGIRIKRMSKAGGALPIRIYNYALFYLSSLLILVKRRPDKILYFDSISAWPALMYKKIFSNKTSLLVHYHEYCTADEYKSQMKLVDMQHEMEKKYYHEFAWISQTNERRKDMFAIDIHSYLKGKDVLKVMPNYPPGTWGMTAQKTNERNNTITRLVYVGSLGYETMYLQELVNWLSINRELFSLDVYAYNIDSRSAALLKNYPYHNIQFKGGCDYYALPGILKKYDVGLVFYKPFSVNTIYAVSNKVFEYLACGLDVWFSEEMLTTHALIKEDSYPKVIKTDFKNLDGFDHQAALSRQGLSYKPSIFYCEDIYRELETALLA